MPSVELRVRQTGASVFACSCVCKWGRAERLTCTPTNVPAETGISRHQFSGWPIFQWRVLICPISLDDVVFSRYQRTKVPTFSGCLKRSLMLWFEARYPKPDALLLPPPMVRDVTVKRLLHCIHSPVSVPFFSTRLALPPPGRSRGLDRRPLRSSGLSFTFQLRGSDRCCVVSPQASV